MEYNASCFKTMTCVITFCTFFDLEVLHVTCTGRDNFYDTLYGEIPTILQHQLKHAECLGSL